MGTKGILGEKLGMTQVFTDEGRALPVTVIKAGPCRVVQVKTEKRDGYPAVQLSYGSPGRVSKPRAGHFEKADAEPARYLVELRTDEKYEAGQELRADVFQPGYRTDVVGVSKGKGFTGSPFRRTSKWRCVPEQLPVQPATPRRWPFRSRCPTLTCARARGA